MHIFKLIFEHDLRLNALAGDSAVGNDSDPENPLADFMKPDPTYSKFYLSASDIEKNRFGLNVIDAYPKIMETLETAFHDKIIITTGGHATGSLLEIINALPAEEAIALADTEPDFDRTKLPTGINSRNGKLHLKHILEQEQIVIYKEQAYDGFDLHLFSKNNIYRNMFFPLQRLAPGNFRFFSINGKKLRNERQFYFETWTLHRPPHGFEEVFPESVL